MQVRFPKIVVLFVFLILLMPMTSSVCFRTQAKAGGENRVFEIINRAEKIVSRIEEQTDCWKNKRYNPKTLEQRAELVKKEIRKIDDPVLLREVLYLSEFRFHMYCRLAPDSQGPICYEADTHYHIEIYVLARLSKLDSETSVKVLMELFSDTSLSWDGEGALLIGMFITKCGDKALPHLQFYVKHGGKRDYFAHELIKYIQEGKIYGP